MPRKLSRGEFFARQKADAWAHAQNPAAREMREISETALTLIEERGHANALAWADHCMIRSTDGFWRKVRDEIQRVRS
jgi:hypothetical protein